MNYSRPAFNTSNYYIYPNSARILMPRLSKLSYYDWIFTWFIWRRPMPDSSHKFFQVLDQQYIERDKRELSQEITDAFDEGYINVVFPFEQWRVYACFFQPGELERAGDIVPELITQLPKFQVDELIDDWGLYHV